MEQKYIVAIALRQLEEKILTPENVILEAIKTDRAACLEIYKEGFDKNWVAQDVIDAIEARGKA